MSKRRLVALTGFLSLAGLLADACSSSGSGHASGPYLIGMSDDMSGPISPLDQEGAAGRQTYVDCLNASGGVNGRGVDLISLNNESNPALGRSDYQELAELIPCSAGVDVTGKVTHLHGGLGYTWESGVHVFTKRAMLNRSLFGSPVAHRRRLACRYSGGGTW
jgi:hypothetical protein